MAEAHPILCSKCKKPGTADKSECASCHGRVVRKCGACGFTNSAAKKYCDACGENFSLVKPPPAPKPEAKAPPKPEPKPEPKPAPKPEPRPAPKPTPQIKLEDIKLPEPRPDDASPLELRPRMDTPAPRPITDADRAKAEPKPEPPKPAPPKLEPAKPAEAPKPADLPPPGKPKEGKSAKDEAMERFLPKTIISRIPQKDKQAVQHDDEPVPDMRPPEKPAAPKKESSDAPPADGPPARKKDFLKMRLEGQTPPPEPLPPLERKPDAKPEAKPAPKAEPKPEPKPEKAPAEARKPGELDPRLIKGFERHEKEKAPAGPPPKKVEGPSQTFIQRRPKAVFSTVMALFLLGTGFAAYYFKSRQKADPADTLIKTAGDYLFTLKQKDFDKAYAMLSADSRRAAAAGAFRALQDEGFWSFDDLGGEIVGPGWAVVRYKLLVPNQPVETDWLVMRFEEGRWTRAYWWPLMTGIEEALARGDHAAAARLAREALAIDPLDPMPAAYYCEAAWMAGDASAALESCSKALKQAETLPSRIGNDGIFRARHLIADVHRHTLKKPAEAAELYGQLLKYPRIEPAQACDLNLAKAEADLELGRQDGALESFRQAQAACRAEADAAFAAVGVQVLSGAAGADAVAAVQSHRMPGDESTLAEWRTKSRAELSKRLKTRPQDLPAENWIPAHKAGPVYTVVLKVGDTAVLSAEADLFSYKIKVDMNVQ